MNNIRVDIRLRPIRFGFLVRPDDKENILEIFRINTCLWGGMFNPIIPLCESVPSWLESEGFHFENPKQIINGYLDFFEPDFLVEAEEGLADGFGFGPRRVLQLTDILERQEEESWDKYGLSVQNLYLGLYQEEFRFELRHQRNIVHVEAKESIFAGFTAANFGGFPAQEQLRYFEDNYKGIFNPQHKTLDAAVLLELYKSEYISALEIGCAKLRVNYNEYLAPTLFILDPQESKGLIDFWNLRAVCQNVKAVPIQWIKELLSLDKEFIQNRYALMFSDSTSKNDRQDIYKNYLCLDKQNIYIPQIWYPPIWSKSSEMRDRTIRPTLEADKTSIDIQVDGDNPEIQFDPLFPNFANKHGGRFRVANVVKLEDWSNTGQIATVFPCNYKNPTLPKFGRGRKYLLPTTEGLVIVPEHRDFSERWQLVDGTTAFNQWFEANKVTAILSDAGRAAQQIIQTLGGCWGVSHLAHKSVIEYLNKISKRPVTKTANYQAFQDELGEEIFEALVKRKVVELGLKLKCSKCSEWNWYSLTQLDYSLTCGLCLRQFDFPIVDPIDKKRSKWAYRLIGPFAQPDYAKGGYTSALAIRFFANVIGEIGESEVTWSSGQELTLPTGEKIEADFMLWYQRENTFEINHPTETVFGEAKSFSKAAFKQDNVDNMKLLAETFPGSVLVFATMREGTDLSKGEINRIKKLAEWGREYDQKSEQTRAPVMVLTGTELFSAMFLEESWEEKGGKHEALIQVWKGHNNLRLLAELTQELYLGMPPYEAPKSTGDTAWLPAEPSAKKPEKD